MRVLFRFHVAYTAAVHCTTSTGSQFLIPKFAGKVA